MRKTAFARLMLGARTDPAIVASIPCVRKPGLCGVARVNRGYVAGVERYLSAFQTLAPMRPYRTLSLSLIAVVTTATALHAHDLFFRLRAYFVAPGTAMRLPVLNGTFSKSENSISWDRVRDLSVVGPAGRASIDSAAWDTRGDTSFLAYTPTVAGTHVAGLSTRPRELDEKAADFNKYLADDGVPDILALRTRTGTLTSNARERYQKHVKAIFQVGDARTDGWRTALGYPAELVPTSNPYDVKVGGSLAFRCLVDGTPVPNQYVMIGGRRPDDTRLPARHARCDKQGVVHVNIDAAGIWYVKFIHMTPVTDGAVTFESKWASLTFGVR